MRAHSRYNNIKTCIISALTPQEGNMPVTLNSLLTTIYPLSPASNVHASLFFKKEATKVAISRLKKIKYYLWKLICDSDQWNAIGGSQHQTNEIKISHNGFFTKRKIPPVKPITVTERIIGTSTFKNKTTEKTNKKCFHWLLKLAPQSEKKKKTATQIFKPEISTHSKTKNFHYRDIKKVTRNRYFHWSP